jgi:hypothetical protein
VNTQELANKDGYRIVRVGNWVNLIAPSREILDIEEWRPGAAWAAAVGLRFAIAALAHKEREW